MLANIDKKLAHDTEILSIQLHDEEGAKLSVQDIRDHLLDPDLPSALKDRYLRALILRAQTGGGVWQSAAIHVMIPSLRRLARKVSRHGRTEIDEADSEFITSFLEVLSTVDPEVEDLEAHLCRATARSAAKFLRHLRREAPMEDIEMVAALRSTQSPTEVITEAALQQKSVSRRSTPSNRQQVEGERWGAMLHRLELHEKTQGFPEQKLHTHEKSRVVKNPEIQATSIQHKEKETSMQYPTLPVGPEKAPVQETPSTPATPATRARQKSKALTIPELLNLPAIVSLKTAAKAIDMSIGTAYKLVHQNRFPCTVLRPSHHYKVPTAGLLRCLEIENSLVRLEDVEKGASFAREEE